MPEYIMPGKNHPDFQSLDEFTQAYIETALWTEEDRLAEDGAGQMSGTTFVTVNGKPTGETVFLPGGIGFELLAPETLKIIIADCNAFRTRVNQLLLATGANLSQNGHDFWPTRNRHGAGFWDRGYGDIGGALTRAAHSFGEFSLYVGDDGLIYAV